MLNANNPSLSSTLPLIVHSVDNEQLQTVNARDLHSFLEVGRDFRNWIKDRIEIYQFKENVDYVSFLPNLARNTKSRHITPQNGEVMGRGQPKIDCHITLDMAKELAMLERNEQGRNARKYFIACEKALRKQTAVSPQLDMRLLVSIENSQIVETKLLPKEACIIHHENIDEVLQYLCPDKKLLDMHIIAGVEQALSGLRALGGESVAYKAPEGLTEKYLTHRWREAVVQWIKRANRKSISGKELLIEAIGFKSAEITKKDYADIGYVVKMLGYRASRGRYQGAACRYYHFD